MPVTFLSNLTGKRELIDEIKSKNILLEKYESDLVEMKQELNSKNINLGLKNEEINTLNSIINEHLDKIAEKEEDILKLEGELGDQDLELKRMDERVHELIEIVKVRDADIQEKNQIIVELNRKIRDELFIHYFIVISLSILYYLRI